jgi:hypothetical protein
MPHGASRERRRISASSAAPSSLAISASRATHPAGSTRSAPPRVTHFWGRCRMRRASRSRSTDCGQSCSVRFSIRTPIPSISQRGQISKRMACSARSSRSQARTTARPCNDPTWRRWVKLARKACRGERRDPRGKPPHRPSTHPPQTMRRLIKRRWRFCWSA